MSIYMYTYTYLSLPYSCVYGNSITGRQKQVRMGVHRLSRGSITTVPHEYFTGNQGNMLCQHHVQDYWVTGSEATLEWARGRGAAKAPGGRGRTDLPLVLFSLLPRALPLPPGLSAGADVDLPLRRSPGSSSRGCPG